MSNPFISVILPVYNADPFLAESIQSILNQSFEDFELLLIDDGSTDKSLEVINSFADKRIRIIENGVNKGLVFTLNKGLELSKGKYIARMDADDISAPQRFERQIKAMEADQEIIVCGTQAEYFGVITGISKLPVSSDEIKAGLFFGSCFIHPSVMIRRSVLEQFKIVYQSKYIHLEDYEMWFQLFSKGKFLNVNEPLIKYRVGEQNITFKHKETRQERLKDIYEIPLMALGLEVTAANRALLLELGFNSDNIVSYKRLKQFKDLVIDKNKLSGTFEESSFKKLVNEKWHKIFYKAADKGFFEGLKYYMAGGKLSGGHLKYQLGKLRRHEA